MVTDSQQYEAIDPAITEVVSEPQELIALVYGHSSQDTYNAVAFKVTRSVRRHEYIQNPFNGPLNDGGTKEFGWFGEDGFSQDVTDPGDGLFEIQEDRAETMAEYGFTIPQDGVYVGVQTGGGDSVNGLREGSDRDRGFSADDLDSYGGVLSDFTQVSTPSATQDRAMPTTALSPESHHGLIRIDSQTAGPNRFYFAFKNISGGNVTIDVQAVGRTYEVSPVGDTDVVRDIVRGEGYPDRRLLTYGGFGNSNPNLPSEWYDGEAEIKEAELTPGTQS